MKQLNYIIAFSLLSAVYIIGLFVPLLDWDSAHHANIALKMYLDNNYAFLVDRGSDYLDKPHLLFWLAAASYHVFGVTTFAYKFPSLLFTALGAYSTFKLGNLLYDKETGKLAALIFLSGLAQILSNNDVRMDAILTSSIIFSIWQFAEFIKANQFKNLVLGCLGASLAFATKGMLGVIVPAIAVFAHLLSERKLNVIFNWKWLISPLLIAIFISPVLYCYYLQFDLPQKMIDGKQVSGIKFILWDQNFERFSGQWTQTHKKDFFFFFHTFLWAFLPWSVYAYIALAKRVYNGLKNRIPNKENLTVITILIILIFISFSNCKLPHYLNIVFPLFSILLAGYLTTDVFNNPKAAKTMLQIQKLTVTIMILFALTLLWVFPINKIQVIILGMLLLAYCLYWFISKNQPTNTKIVMLSITGCVFANFLLNANYYPQLIQYQAGYKLAAIANQNIKNGEPVYFMQNDPMQNFSFDFYTERLNEMITLPKLLNINKNQRNWIYTDEYGLEQLKNSKLKLGKIFSASNYRVSKARANFLNPKTRKETLKQMYLVEVL